MGKTTANTTVDATSTALVRMLAANSTLTEDDLKAQASSAQYAVLITGILNWLKNSTSASGSSIVDDDTVASAATSAGKALQGNVQLIKDSYASLKTSLENNSASVSQRINDFLSFISPEFKDISGASNYSDLASSTESRLTRYTINSYSFTIV
ncbi:hypothetical protein HYY75_00750 [bacterium]|nr:hypothetical protein [bacterium]